MKKKRKAKIIRNSKKRLKKKHDDSFRTFVKVFICGIILLNGIAVVPALILKAFDFCYGLLLGSAASFFYLWSFVEERKKYLFVLKSQNDRKPPRAFVIRYLSWAVFLGLSGLISVYALAGTFYSLFMIRIIIYFIAYKTREI